MGFPVRRNPTAAGCLAHVAESFGVDVADLHADHRFQPLAGIRMIAMIVARHATGQSYARLGKLFKRDHTTIVHACSHMRKQAKISPWTRDRITQLTLDMLPDHEGLVDFSGMPAMPPIDTPRFLEAKLWIDRLQRPCNGSGMGAKEMGDPRRETLEAAHTS
jgi:hypothetical protein